LAIRVVVTLVCLGLFLAGSILPSPLIDPEVWAEFRSIVEGPLPFGTSGRVSWIPLGIMPFVTAFLLIEVASLIVPYGRRLRRTGVEGRRRIDRAALVAAFVLTWVQAAGVALFLMHTRTPWGSTLTTAPASVWTVTVATGTFAAVGLAALISRFGLGNGFVMLFIGNLLFWTLRDSAVFLVLEPSTDPENRIMNTMITGLFFGVVVFLFRRARSVEVTPVGPVEEGARSAPLPLRIPAVPQGGAPLSWVYAFPSAWIYAIPSALLFFPALADRLWLDPGTLGALIATTAGIVAFSVLAAWMFSAHGRAVTNLEGVAEVPKEGWERVWKVQLAIATAVLLGGHVLPDYLHLSGAEGVWLLVSVDTALFLVAAALDLRNEGRLVRAAPGGALAHVVTLDNVHLAEYFRARFEREGIPHAVRAFHFRSLFYFLGPLYKMTLLVPEGEAERAAELVAATDFRIV
jgi:preprotein translocase subunit SecY